MGWKIDGFIPDEIDKAVMVIAPHTSLWDFILGRLAFNVLGRKVSFIIKKEFFFFPLGFLLKKWGGIPINRKSGTESFMQLKKHFDAKPKLILVITPEGTRKPVEKWRRGYYLVAKQNQVPLILGSLDYKMKKAYIAEPMEVTGNYSNDIASIRKFYHDKTGKFPDKFNPEFK